MLTSMPHLFLAEDDQYLSHFFAEVAQEEGWRVTRCENGLELIDALQDVREPAMALIDIHMPEMDGIDVIEHLTNHADSLRIRFLTGGDTSFILAAYMMAAARSFNIGRNVFKPLQALDFRRILAAERQELRKLLDRPPSVSLA